MLYLKFLNDLRDQLTIEGTEKVIAANNDSSVSMLDRVLEIKDIIDRYCTGNDYQEIKKHITKKTTTMLNLIKAYCETIKGLCALHLPVEQENTAINDIAAKMNQEFQKFSKYVEIENSMYFYNSPRSSIQSFYAAKHVNTVSMETKTKLQTSSFVIGPSYLSNK